MREVVKENGVQFPDGQIVPKGAWLAIPAVGIHYDERFYPSPETYDPFRFVPDSAKDAETAGPTANVLKPAGGDLAQAQEPKHRGLSTTLSTASPTFLGFGYGRHSW